MAIEAPSILRTVHRPLSLDADHRHSRPQQSRVRCTLSILPPATSGMGKPTETAATIERQDMTDQIPQMQLVEKAKKKPLIPEPSVALMLQKVIDGGITADNVSALEALVGLYERMEAKNAEKEFAAAFEKVQSGVKRIQATHIVPDKHGVEKYKVAKFQEVWDKVEPLLIQEGFTASFAQKYEEGLPLRVTTIFILQHTASGHKTETPFTVRVGNGPPGCSDFQADGAAASYAKMRAMCGKLNIIIESGDDDARMIGESIGSALAGDLAARVEEVGADREAFLKFAGAKEFEEISDQRWPELDAMLKRKESAKAAREKLSPEGEWK